jgi:DNA topoisomerase-2
LSSSTALEAQVYFSDMDKHCIKLEYSGNNDDYAIQLAFSDKLSNERKEWLSKFMEERNEKNETTKAQVQNDTHSITFTDFINDEFVLYSNLRNEQSIPSLVDGFTPGN